MEITLQFGKPVPGICLGTDEITGILYGATRRFVTLALSVRNIGFKALLRDDLPPEIDRAASSSACSVGATSEPHGNMLDPTVLANRGLIRKQLTLRNSKQARYPVSVILNSVKLRYMLPNADNLTPAVVASLQIVMPSGAGAAVATAIKTGRVKLMCGRQLRRATVKLDTLTMLWRRKQFRSLKGAGIARYLSCDSSPQIGYDYLCSREDSLVLSPSLESILRSSGSQSALAAISVDSRSLPVGVIGGGNSGLEQKAAKLLWSILLETGLEFAHDYRSSVYAFLSDQGVERKLADTPFPQGDLVELTSQLAAGTFSWSSADVVDAFFFPRCIYTPGHLHILYNALEEATKSIEAWTDIKFWITTLLKFLSRKSYRQLFIFHCLAGKPALQKQFRCFSGYKVRLHFTWLGH